MSDVTHLQLPDHTLACGADHLPYHTQELHGDVVIVVTHEICCTRLGGRYPVTCAACIKKNPECAPKPPTTEVTARPPLPWPPWHNRRYVPLYGAVD